MSRVSNADTTKQRKVEYDVRKKMRNATHRAYNVNGTYGFSINNLLKRKEYVNTLFVANEFKIEFESGENGWSGMIIYTIDMLFAF